MFKDSKPATNRATTLTDSRGEGRTSERLSAGGSVLGRSAVADGRELNHALKRPPFRGPNSGPQSRARWWSLGPPLAEHFADRARRPPREPARKLLSVPSS